MNPARWFFLAVLALGSLFAFIALLHIATVLPTSSDSSAHCSNIWEDLSQAASPCDTRALLQLPSKSQRRWITVALPAILSVLTNDSAFADSGPPLPIPFFLTSDLSRNQREALTLSYAFADNSSRLFLLPSSSTTCGSSEIHTWYVSFFSSFPDQNRLNDYYSFLFFFFLFSNPLVPSFPFSPIHAPMPFPQSSSHSPLPARFFQKILKIHLPVARLALFPLLLLPSSVMLS